MTQLQTLSIGNPVKIWGMLPKIRTEKIWRKIAKDPEGVKEQTVFVRDDGIYDASVLRALYGADKCALVSAEGQPLAVAGLSEDEKAITTWLSSEDAKPLKGYQTKTPEDIVDPYNEVLRKREDPYCEITRLENTREIEWRLYMGSYKGVTDIVTKYVWPVPAFHVSRLCAFLKLSPNMVTSVGAILMLLALYLFWQGEYGLGLLAGWIMTFLDTVDGKLARCTLTSSKWGNIFDHGIDLIHPPFWYMAWVFGLSAYGTPVSDSLASMLIIGGFVFYIAGRLCEGYFIQRHDFHIHVWRKIDSFFRLIVARRNPNMIILNLSLFIARPDLGVIAITLYAVITFFIHILQIVQADLARSKSPDKALVSWLQQETA
jgi:phosphatidylglycerophosphate synthase